MQKLDIKIERAQLTNYNVAFDNEGKIHVTATLALFTKEGRQITTQQISTRAWSDEKKFELPHNCYRPIMDMGSELEKVITKHCQDPLISLQ